MAPRRRDFRAEAARRSAAQKKADALIRAAKTVPCMDCGGVFDPVCMDFDHRPGEQKIMNVSKIRTYGIETIKREIAKCDVVCANCHRLRTHRRPPPVGRGRGQDVFCALVLAAD